MQITENEDYLVKNGYKLTCFVVENICNVSVKQGIPLYNLSQKARCYQNVVFGHILLKIPLCLEESKLFSLAFIKASQFVIHLILIVLLNINFGAKLFCQ
jgi:hypothetical protein